MKAKEILIIEFQRHKLSGLLNCMNKKLSRTSFSSYAYYTQ